MNIFIREMKAHRKSLLLWCIGMFFMIVSGMAKYASYTGASQSLNDILATLPKSIRTLLGMGNFDLTTLSGFYGMLYFYLLILATIHSAMLGANIVAKEEREKTTEFLMVKPVSRIGIITSKLLCGLTNVFILNLVTLIFSILIVNQYGNGEKIFGTIAVLMIGMMMLQLVFLFIGTGIASISKNPKISPSIATGIILVTFLLSMIVDLNGHLSFLKYLTPFKYFQADSIMYGGGMDGFFVILSFIIIVMSIIVTYVFYNKRDLKV